jgi:hypothetical protein
MPVNLLSSGGGTTTLTNAASASNFTLTLPALSGTVLTSASTITPSDGSVTQAKLATAVVPVGVGQTWQDVTGSRSVGVTYTNTTGRPIVVCVNGFGSTAANPVRIIVDGVIVSRFEPIAVGNTQAVVPTGSTYIFFAPNGLVTVVELR